MRNKSERNGPVSCSREVMGGTPVFAGTRVPVQTLIDYLEAGDRLDDFLDDFPTVSREQALQVLELAKEALLATLRPLLRRAAARLRRLKPGDLVRIEG